MRITHRVVFHSREWDHLVEQGYVTHTVDIWQGVPWANMVDPIER